MTAPSLRTHQQTYSNGFGANSGGTVSVTVSNDTGDLLVAAAFSNGINGPGDSPPAAFCPASISNSGSAITWTLRKTITWVSTDGATHNELDIYYGFAESATVNVTATYGSGNDINSAALGVFVFENATGFDSDNPFYSQNSTADDSLAPSTTDANVYAYGIYVSSDTSFTSFTEPSISGGNMGTTANTNNDNNSNWSVFCMYDQSGGSEHLTGSTISLNNGAIAHAFFMDAVTSDAGPTTSTITTTLKSPTQTMAVIQTPYIQTFLQPITQQADVSVFNPAGHAGSRRIFILS